MRFSIDCSFTFISANQFQHTYIMYRYMDEHVNKCTAWLPSKQRVCSPRSRLPSILSRKESGSHVSDQNGMETVSPKW